MKHRQRSTDEATSIQIGFVLNTGILTAFIAVLLVVISGGFGEDTSTTEELSLVADSVQSKIVEADTLAIEKGGSCVNPDRCFTAYFKPPSSEVRYEGELDGPILKLTADGTTVTRNLNNALSKNYGAETLDGGLNVEFSQRDQNIIVVYNKTTSTPQFEIEVQRSVGR